MDWFANTFPDPANHGSTLTIVVTGGTPNATLKVRIQDGEDLDQAVEVVTDGDGAGAIEWQIPSECSPVLFLDTPGSDTHVVALY